MPTITFFNLNEEKKTRVIKAIKNEFKRAPILDMSVKNIVEEAKIARGSFYQYFITREDAIDYIIEEEIKIEKDKVKKMLEDKNGDFFTAFYDYLDMNIDELCKDPRYYINVLEYIRSTKSLPVKPLEIENIINESRLKETNFSSIYEVETALYMLMVITNVTKLSILEGVVSKKEGLRQYKTELEILKYGIMKK